MAYRFPIPDEVIRDIRNWTRHAELAAIADFPQTSADEDAIVESFGARLRCRVKEVHVAGQSDLPGLWKWSIAHTRFRGRGRGAVEKHIGADVIIELELRSRDGYQNTTKALLIQATKDWTIDYKIVEQAARLSTWREAAAVMNLTA